MVLNILMIMLGLSMLIYSFFEICVWGSLYFDRDTYCIEKFRKLTKTTDLVSCMHNITKCVFGVTLIVAGLKRWMPVSNIGIANAALMVCFIMLILDILVVEGSTRARKLRELRSSIEQQWSKEKRVTPEHDHEVNLYRGTVRVTQQYPKHIIAMGVCMIILSIIGV